MRKLRTKRKVVAVLLIAVLLICTGCADKVGGKSLDKTTQDTAEYIVKNVKDVSVGEMGGDWVIFALKSSGTEAASQDYYDAYYDNIRGLLKSSKGVLSKNSLTTYERVSMGVQTVGNGPSKDWRYTERLLLGRFICN